MKDIILWFSFLAIICLSNMLGILHTTESREYIAAVIVSNCTASNPPAQQYNKKESLPEMREVYNYDSL